MATEGSCLGGLSGCFPPLGLIRPFVDVPLYTIYFILRVIDLLPPSGFYDKVGIEGER